MYNRHQLFIVPIFQGNNIINSVLSVLEVLIHYSSLTYKYTGLLFNIYAQLYMEAKQFYRFILTTYIFSASKKHVVVMVPRTSY